MHREHTHRLEDRLNVKLPILQPGHSGTKLSSPAIGNPLRLWNDSEFRAKNHRVSCPTRFAKRRTGSGQKTAHTGDLEGALWCTFWFILNLHIQPLVLLDFLVMDAVASARLHMVRLGDQRIPTIRRTEGR